MKKFINILKNDTASVLGSAAAVVYFIVPMLFVILALLLSPFVFLVEVNTIRNSGFAGANNAGAFIGICGICIGLSLLIPALRKMYRPLPWLYSFITIFFMNMVILQIGFSILNYGYQVVNATRHTIFFILMIVQIVICRGALSIYLRKKL